MNDEREITVNYGEASQVQFEEETLTRAKQANESSGTDPKESKHGEDLYQNAGEGDRSYAIDFKGGQDFGERHGVYQFGLRKGPPIHDTLRNR